MAFIMFLMIILYLSNDQCSGQSMADERHDAGYSCENCIVGSRRGRILCRNCVSGNADTQFTCGRCKIGTESGTFNCRGCSNKDPVFGENMQINLIYVREMSNLSFYVSFLSQLKYFGIKSLYIYHCL